MDAIDWMGEHGWTIDHVRRSECCGQRGCTATNSGPERVVIEFRPHHHQCVEGARLIAEAREALWDQLELPIDPEPF